jgi:DNA polymerase III delta subunit
MAPKTEQAAIPYIVVLTGDDTISRDRAKTEIIQLIKNQQPSVTEEHFDPLVESFAQFMERVITPSLFGGFRIFFVNHAESLLAAEITELNNIVDFDITDVACIVEADVDTGDDEGERGFAGWLKKFSAKAKKRPGRLVRSNFPKPRDYEIARWLVAQVPSLFNRSISPNDAEYLVDRIGSDFDTIYSELQKIDIYLPEKQSLDRASIDDIIQGSRVINPYELAQALGKKDLKRACDMVEHMFESQFYAPPVVSAIFNHFWGLFRVMQFCKRFPEKTTAYKQAAKSGDRQTQNRIALEIGIGAGLMTEKQANRLFPVLIKPDLIGQALSYTSDDFRKIFKMLFEYDVGIKTGRVDGSKTSFQLFCYGIARSSIKE